MRRKVSTLLDDGVFRQTRLEAVRQGRQISEIVGDALRLYLAQTTDRPVSLHIVAGSWGVLPLKPATVGRVLREEPDVLEA